MLANCLVVALGGAAGAVLRYLAGLVPLREPFEFPVKTFAVNVVGGFLIGAIAALALKGGRIDARTALFLRTGLCGGFTTFSTFAFESVSLIEKGRVGVAALYVGLSAACGILAVLLAQWLIQNQ